MIIAGKRHAVTPSSGVVTGDLWWGGTPEI